MERLNSIFVERTGVSVQTLIDRANDRFAPLFYPRFFRMGAPSVSLDFTTVIGRSAIQSIAPIISDESEIPLHARQGLEKLQGEVPTIAVARSMSAKEYREMQVMQAMGINEGVELSALFDMIYNDFTYVGNGVHKRMDAMVLQALSTGKITVSLDNNPESGVRFDLDLLLADNHRWNPVKAWTDPTADIIRDIEDAVLLAQDEGRPIDKILISRKLWGIVARNSSIQEYLKAYNGIASKYAVTFGAVNEALSASLLPPFEIVDERQNVQNDGIPSPFRFWNDDSAVFVPLGDLGIIHNSLSNEQIMNSPDVYQYGYYRNAQLMRWYHRRPLVEYTACEWKAFPGLEAIDGIFIMDTATPKA